VLFGLLYVVNYLAGPQPSDGKARVAAPATAKVAVQHDPRASAVERWRNEIAAMKAAEQAQTADNASIAAKSEPEPAKPVPTALKAPEPKPAAQPQQAAAAQPAVETSAAALTSPQDDEATKLAAQKVKIAKAKATKAKLARERSAARMAAGDGGVPVAGHYSPSRERSASNLQDQYYYGQRAASLQPAPSSTYAYAPRQSYGPFGFGRAW
jgi:type IV secretory pathway VirB10-like protein